jgi:hypothetical protein
MMRALMSSVLPLPCSSFRRSVGNSGVRFSKRILCLELFRFGEIDFRDLQQGKIAFTIFGGADLAFNGVAGAQIKTPDLAG